MQDLIEKPETQKRLLTHSATSAFFACPRRYQLSYVRGLRPLHDGDALRLGSGVHTGLEVLKNGETADAAVLEIRRTYAERACPPWLTSEEYDVERETACTLVAGWAWRYAHADGIEYLAAELPFELPLINPETGRPTPKFMNAGKIDGIGRLADGRIALIEHKTTSDDIGVESDYWKRLDLDGQISRYWLAAHELGYPVSTVVFDVVKKPGIRPKNVAKADRALATSQREYCGMRIEGVCPERETPQMYSARLLKDLTERPEFYFARKELPRLNTDLNEFRRDAWAAVQQINSCERNAYFPRNANACLEPYRCAFLSVCRGLCGDPNEQVPEGFRVIKNKHPELEASSAT